MNIAELAIKNKIVTFLFAVIFLIGGAFSFKQLGRFEDPEFTIKSAIITTYYPGASPSEVENEVTDRIERATLELPELDKITSLSSEGRSIVTVDIKPEFTKKELPQIWQKLRNKISDVQGELPPGVMTSQVNDDFGDVYGILFAVTSNEYSYAELKDFVDFLRKEILQVSGVAKISLWGIQQQAIFIDLLQTRLAQLKIPEKNIYDLLNVQNRVVPAGKVSVGEEYIQISPTGTANSVEKIGDLVVNGSSERVIHLYDIANISRGYMTPPNTLMRYNGKPAIGLGISTIDGGNVIKTGDAVKAKLKSLENLTPAGIEINVISYQSDTVTKSINSFLRALIEAFVIVVITLVVTMGLRSGLLQGLVMLITMGSTMILMHWMHIDLQRISLGALIIALGMLVDDAIVINEGVLVNLEKGYEKVKSAIQIVKENCWPLLAATIINILAFAAISFSPDNTGEYCHSLFWVILISLLMSWVVAITITPLLATIFLKAAKHGVTDPYDSLPYHIYQRLLKTALQFRALTITTMVILLIVAIYGFSFVKHSFFPDSDRAQFMIDYWLPEGMHIDVVSKNLETIEEFLLKNKQVTDVSTFVGAGAPRFILTYTPENPDKSYGLLLVSVKNYHEIDKIIDATNQFISQNFPDAQPNMNKFKLGTGGIGTVKVRIQGPQTAELRKIAEKVLDVYYQNNNAINIKTNWRNQTPVIRPDFFEVGARLTGITKSDLSMALEEAFDGRKVGIYRESNELIPIVARRDFNGRIGFDNLFDLTIWSPAAEKAVSISQVINGVNTIWQDPFIYRRDQIRTIEIQCDPKKGLASELFKDVRKKVEDIPLPSGYAMAWGGEYEDSQKAQAGLWKGLPMSYLAMALIVVILFNSIRLPLIIFLCVPLAIIGVSFGLLVTHTPFGFMALLGFLSLSGILIKNAIVLIDHIQHMIKSGVEHYQAVIEASISRFRPVMMTAITASLGLIPLLPDVFFRGMAVTIIFGLSFATILTLIVVPVLYAVFFNISNPKIQQTAQT